MLGNVCWAIVVINPLHPLASSASCQPDTFLWIKECALLCAAPCIRSLELVRPLTSVSRVYCSAVKILPGLKLDRKNVSAWEEFLFWVWFELVQPFSTCRRTMEQESLSLLSSFKILPEQYTRQAALRPQSSLQLQHRVSVGCCGSSLPCNRPDSIPFLALMLAQTVAHACSEPRLLKAILAMVQTGEIRPCCCSSRDWLAEMQNHQCHTSVGFWLFPELVSVPAQACPPVVEVQVGSGRLRACCAVLGGRLPR